MLKKWRLFCNTENEYVYWWMEGDNPAPLRCPNDSSHIISEEIAPVIVEINDQPRQDENNNLIVRPSYGHILENSVWKGAMFKAIGGQTTFFDQEITTEIKLQGGSYRILNYSNVGWNGDTQRDFIEFSIIDKNDVLGLFSKYGLTVGQDILEVFKFVRNAHVLESETFLDKYSAFPVVPGLFFRVAYNSVGTSPQNDVVVLIRLYWFE